jgi:hypothetical protein
MTVAIRRLALALTMCAPIMGCSKEEHRPTEQAPARQGSDAAFADILASQQQQPALAIDPSSGVIELGGERQAKFTLKATGGDIEIARIRVLPKEALGVHVTDCPSILGADTTCTITVPAAEHSVPGTAVLIVDGAGSTASADVALVGSAPAQERETAPVIERETVDPDEALRMQLEAEALAGAGDNTGPGVTRSTPGGEAFSGPADGANTIFAGTSITVTLMDPILAAKDGTARATVSWPVYGGIAPRTKSFHPKVLLPANSLVILAYSGGSADGRIDLRLLEIRDGHNRRLRPAETFIKDAVGQQGAPAQVEKRLVERSVAEFIATGLAVAPLYLAGGTSTTTLSAGGTTTTQDDKSKAAEIATDRFTALADDVTQSLIDTKPRERLPRGAMLTLMPTDNWLVELPEGASPAAESAEAAQ